MSNPKCDFCRDEVTSEQQAKMPDDGGSPAYLACECCIWLAYYKTGVASADVDPLNAPFRDD